MAVNPNLPAPEPTATVAAEVSAPVTPQSDPTPAQIEGASVVKQLDAEIDDLWSKLEGQERTPDRRERLDAAPETVAIQEATPPADTAQPVAETPPAPSQADLEKAAEERVRARIEAEQAAERAAEAKIAAEQQHRQAVEGYLGRQDDYHAVEAALRQANLTNDYSQLDALDVLLPDGRLTSAVKGSKGLTLEEAASVLNAWDTARRFEDQMGDRKLGAVLAYWDAQTVEALDDPDVDAAAVRTHRTPGEQMKTAIESVRAAVTTRLKAEHDAVVAAKDAEIAKQNERIASLLNERGNLVSQNRAADAATPDRPGATAPTRTGLPTPEELAAMSSDEAFKSGHIDRLLQVLPGSLPRRRAG